MILSKKLLAWYDQNARDLPWRMPPHRSNAGELPDAYRVWLSEIMLQQTTVASVKTYFHEFTRRWPSVHDLAAADSADVMAAWAGLGYYARARNLLKTANIIANDLGGSFPDTNAGLQELPGIGPYTAAAISAFAFGRCEVVVDGNVERVMVRFFAETTPLPAVKKQLYELAKSVTPRKRAGDYAQAVMDLGATICTPRNPDCSICPLSGGCLGFAQSLAAEFPYRAPKTVKPTRLGIIYVALRDDGAMLLERRADKGLLGGMLGWPGSDWNEQPTEAAPMVADWQSIPSEVRHTFTHFHLRLEVRVALVPNSSNPERGEFFSRSDVGVSDLPTLMRKTYDAAMLHLEKI